MDDEDQSGNPAARIGRDPRVLKANARLLMAYGGNRDDPLSLEEAVKHFAGDEDWRRGTVPMLRHTTCVYAVLEL